MIIFKHILQLTLVAGSALAEVPGVAVFPFPSRSCLPPAELSANSLSQQLLALHDTPTTLCMAVRLFEAPTEQQTILDYDGGDHPEKFFEIGEESDPYMTQEWELDLKGDINLLQNCTL